MKYAHYKATELQRFILNFLCVLKKGEKGF